MTEFMVQLTSMSEVKRFVNIASRQSFDIAIVSDRYSVDAKSIIAIFCHDFSKPLRVKAECGQAECADFQKAIEEFIVDET